MLNKAIKYATEKHCKQKRKGTDIPYIVHPLETMTILNSMNADDTLLIAGVLHDVVEDTEATIEEVRNMFGNAVADLVGEHTEDKSKTWKERKEESIKATAEGSRSLKMLVMADKVSNLRALFRDVGRWKEEVWKRFNAPKQMQAWYCSKLIDALNEMQYDKDARDVYWEMVDLFKDIFVSYYYHWEYESIYQVAITNENYYLTASIPEWKKLTEEVPSGAEKIDRKLAERIEDNWIDEFVLQSKE